MKTRKLLSLALALVLVASFISVPAFAGTGDMDELSSVELNVNADPKVGDTLTATASYSGGSGDADDATFKWLRADVGNLTDVVLAAATATADAGNSNVQLIDGKTTGTYDLVADDEGKFVYVLASQGSISKSAVTAKAVVAAPPAKVDLAAVSIADPKVNVATVVTATAGATGLTYQWYLHATAGDKTAVADLSKIAGATAATYAPVANDKDKFLYVEVTQPKASTVAGTADIVKLSAGKKVAEAAAAAAADKISSVKMTLNDTAGTAVPKELFVGNALKAVLTTNPTGKDSSMTIKWYRSDAKPTASAMGTVIADATGATYTVTADDMGKFIAVEVTDTQATPAKKFAATPAAVMEKEYAAIAGSVLDLGSDTITLGGTFDSATQTIYTKFTAVESAALALAAAGENTAKPSKVSKVNGKTFDVSKLLDKRGVLEVYITAKAGSPLKDVAPATGAISKTYWFVGAARPTVATADKIAVATGDKGKGYMLDEMYVQITGPAANTLEYRQEAEGWKVMPDSALKLPYGMNAAEYQVRVFAKNGAARAAAPAAIGDTVTAASKLTKVKVAGYQKPTTVKVDFVKGTIALKDGMQISEDDGNSWKTVSKTAGTGVYTAAELQALGISPDTDFKKFALLDAAYTGGYLSIRTPATDKKPATYPQLITFPMPGVDPKAEDFALSADGKKIVYMQSYGVVEYLDTSKATPAWKKGLPKYTAASGTTAASLKDEAKYKLNATNGAYEKVESGEDGTGVLVRYQATYATGPSPAYLLTAAELKLPGASTGGGSTGSGSDGGISWTSVTKTDGTAQVVGKEASWKSNADVLAKFKVNFSSENKDLVVVVGETTKTIALSTDWSGATDLVTAITSAIETGLEGTAVVSEVIDQQDHFLVITAADKKKQNITVTLGGELIAGTMTEAGVDPKTGTAHKGVLTLSGTADADVESFDVTITIGSIPVTKTVAFKNIGTSAADVASAICSQFNSAISGYTVTNEGSATITLTRLSTSTACTDAITFSMTANKVAPAPTTKTVTVTNSDSSNNTIAGYAYTVGGVTTYVASTTYTSIPAAVTAITFYTVAPTAGTDEQDTGTGAAPATGKSIVVTLTGDDTDTATIESGATWTTIA